MVSAAGGSAGKRLLASSVTASSTGAAWSPSGARIAFRASDGVEDSLWVADVADPAAPFDLEAHRISQPGPYAPLANWQWSRWSPDDSLIANMVSKAGDGTYDAIVLAADGSGQKALWSGTEDDVYPEWSPSESDLSVLVQAGPGALVTDPYSAYLLDRDGGNPRKIATVPLSGWTPLSFSPDGTRVVASSPAKTKDGSPNDLYAIAVDGNADAVRIDGPGPFGASWQPVTNLASPLGWAPLASPVASPTP